MLRSFVRGKGEKLRIRGEKNRAEQSRAEGEEKERTRRLEQERGVVSYPMLPADWHEAKERLREKRQ